MSFNFNKAGSARVFNGLIFNGLNVVSHKSLCVDCVHHIVHVCVCEFIKKCLFCVDRFHSVRNST